MKGPYLKIWYHFQRTDNKFAKGVTIQPCTRIRYWLVTRARVILKYHVARVPTKTTEQQLEKLSM